MVRILMGCVFLSLAAAQTDPIADAVRGVHEARSRGDFAEAAARREAARKLLQQIPPAADYYRKWVGTVAALYASAGRTLEARAVAGPILLEPGAVLDSRAMLGLSDSAGDRIVGGTSLNSAREALQAGRTEDAFVLGLRALDRVPPTSEAIFSEMPVFASMLALKHARGMADQLWDRLLAVAEARSVDTLLPLLHVTREHARFLAEWPDRTPSARVAIARYRDLLTTAHGAGSEQLATVLRMAIEFEQDHDRPQAAAGAAEELLALASAIHGPDGVGNLTAIQTAAGLYETQGNAPRVRALCARAIAIADAARSRHRAGVRIQAAYAFAHQRDFDEAERMAREAVALDPDYHDELEEVLELRISVPQFRSPGPFQLE
jgi:tetratricopeptide (TPR) repeat protein